MNMWMYFFNKNVRIRPYVFHFVKVRFYICGENQSSTKSDIRDINYKTASLCFNSLAIRLRSKDLIIEFHKKELYEKWQGGNMYWSGVAWLRSSAEEAHVNYTKKELNPHWPFIHCKVHSVVRSFQGKIKRFKQFSKLLSHAGLLFFADWTFSPVHSIWNIENIGTGKDFAPELK